MSTENIVPFKKESSAGLSPEASIMPNLIPYSKGNEELKEPIPRHIILNVGPDILEKVMHAVARAMDQGWSCVSVVFLQYAPTSQVIRSGKQEMVALYIGSICKVFREGEVLVPPTIE